MRILHSGGYSSHQYSPKVLREVAARVAKAIPILLEKYNADAIVVTGKSGHSVAFAALMLVDFPLCVVRKETDQSHGSRVEGPDGVQVHRYLILDDFIASGATVRRVIKTMDDGHQGIQCVGVIEYKDSYEFQDVIFIRDYNRCIDVVNLQTAEWKQEDQE